MGIEHPVWIVAVLAFAVAGSERLARLPGLRHVGSALLVIVVTAVLANLGAIPTVTGGSPVYDGLFRYVAPLAIFWLLLSVGLREVARAGPRMLLLFFVAATGTVVGVLAGWVAAGGRDAFGEAGPALAGMFVGTYTGGSVNFNAVALHYGVIRDGTLYAAAAVVDSAMTTVWMAATVAIPRLWRGADEGTVGDGGPEGGTLAEPETAHAVDVAVLIGLGALALAAADAVGRVTPVPSILVLTTVALLLAQVPAIRALRGARMVGTLAVLFFLAAIGALCDLRALVASGSVGLRLGLLVVVAVTVHGAVVFGFARLARLDPATAAVASQANIGGSTSALALARSLGRSDLVVPGILVGALGNAVGTYLAFAVAWGVD